MESSSALAKPQTATATHTAFSHTQSTSLVKNFRFRSKTWSVKACPHCRRKVRLLHKSETVAVVSPIITNADQYATSKCKRCCSGFPVAAAYNLLTFVW